MPTRRDLLRMPALLITPQAGAPASAEAYGRLRAEIAADRTRLLARWRAGERSAAFAGTCERAVTAGVHRLAAAWLGTRWGLGAPQIERPGDGRVNCGTFVGRLLADAGFVIPVRKLQRQPSALIAATFAPPARIRRFSRVPMAGFVAEVRAMGPGLFIIGLDLHVGLLLRLAGDLRFVHASYLTETVVDEPAADALLIRASGYRVVGKALGPRNLAQWLQGLTIPVVGRY
jgi:hypothetical protein